MSGLLLCNTAATKIQEKVPLNFQISVSPTPIREAGLCLEGDDDTTLKTQNKHFHQFEAELRPQPTHYTFAFAARVPHRNTREQNSFATAVI